MHIDKFLQEDGWYKDSEGISYEYADQAIKGIYELGWCGCGDPDSALEYLAKSLQLIKLLREDDLKWTDWKIEVDKHHKNDGECYFVWYFLDHKGFTEHGGSVPGWLSQKGKELLEDIEEYLETLKPTI